MTSTTLKPQPLTAWKRAAERIVTWTTQVSLPVPDAPGEWQKVPLTLTCRLLNTQAINTALQAGEDSIPQFLADHILGWDHIVGEDDQPLDFSRDLLQTMMGEDPYFLQGCLQCLLEASGAARRGN